jgi:hypothetical protein
VHGVSSFECDNSHETPSCHPFASFCPVLRVPEHPETDARIEDAQIHANHVEAFNASLRRRNSTFRCKTNLYAKTRHHLQRTLDLQGLIHNFVRVNFTTKVIPAVKLGILEVGLSWMELFSIRYAF